MAVAAVPSRARTKPSQQVTQPVAVVSRDEDDFALAQTMMPRARTMIATVVPTSLRADDSSLEIPFDTEVIDSAFARARRPITLGDGMLQRVPQRPMWILHAAVVLATLSIAVVALAAS